MTLDTSFDPSPSCPTLALPKGACDSHFHVFGPQHRFPYPDTALFRPKDAPKEMMFALHELLGIQAGVIVQSGCHGFDNRVVADAIADHPGAYKGIALLPPDVAMPTLRQLDAQGFCGVRYNFMPHLAKSATPAQAVAFASSLAEIGWHLQVHFHADLISEILPVLRAAPVPVVIDHMARLDAGLGLDQPGYQSLLAALENPHFWVKVSGVDRVTRTGPPYADGAAMARDLVARFPDRVVWGSDWPHPNHAGPVPDDGALVDLLAVIAPSAQALQKLMVDNPKRLYGLNV